MEKIYKFGKFKLNETERILLENDQTISLAPKVFDTLLLLVKNRGHLLTKDEMFERIWKGSFVEENNLAQNISFLRKVLRENKKNKFIQTVPKRGYRFVAGVSEVHTQFEHQMAFSEMENMPKTKYVQSSDANIAYQVVGAGEIDIVFVMGWVSHLEYFWKEPNFAAFLNRLASFSRLILFDKRGTGLSDRVPLSQLPTLEQRMEDVHAVMDAVGSEKAVLIGVSEGGPMCSLFAATYPERTSALVMLGTYAKRIKDDDYPWGVSKEDREKFFEMMREKWGTAVGIEERAPTLANDEHFRNWWATYLRMGASPGAAVALTKMNAEIDIRQVLPSIRVPSLVIHRKGDMCLKVEEGRFVAEKIPACKYVELDGVDHLPFVGNQREILDEIENFLLDVRHLDEVNRVLATVLSIRIENQTGEELKSLKNAVLRKIKLHRGKKTAFGEKQLLATFDGPARAVRSAKAILELSEDFEIDLQIGLHTGECDVLGKKYGGMAVEIAKQIAGSSAPGEILTSRTVKDLVAGSGIVFEENGKKSFSQTSGEWQLYLVK